MLKFVAVLGGEDRPDWKGESTGGLDSETARARPDLRFLAFMFDRWLIGDEIENVRTVRADEEVFDYARVAATVVLAGSRAPRATLTRVRLRGAMACLLKR